MQQDQDRYTLEMKLKNKERMADNLREVKRREKVTGMLGKRIGSLTNLVRAPCSKLTSMLTKEEKAIAKQEKTENTKQKVEQSAIKMQLYAWENTLKIAKEKAPKLEEHEKPLVIREDD